MASNVIEREVFISAGIERVWSLVSKVGFWVGEQVHFDNEAGAGEMVTIDTDKYGSYPVRVIQLDPPRYAAYRWASGFPGQEPTDENSTLVEFTLTEQNGGVSVLLKESGFAGISGGLDKYGDNVQGWEGQMEALRKAAEQVAVQ